MATCENHPELAADVVIGNCHTGDQMFVCAPDAARWGLDLAKAVLPPEEVLEALGLQPASAEGVGAGNGRPARSRKRKAEPAAEPEPEPVTAQGPDEVPATAPDGGDSGV